MKGNHCIAEQQHLLCLHVTCVAQTLDLADFASVHTFVKEAIGSRPVTALVHNAGVMGVQPQLTKDGHEITLQVTAIALVFTNFL